MNSAYRPRRRTLNSGRTFSRYGPRSRGLCVYLSIILSLLLLSTFIWDHRSINADETPQKEDHHAIARLMQNASCTFDAMLETQTTTFEETVARYRSLRGRHPPPRFDVWFEFAKSHDSIFIESFFDQIYEDLVPFWSLDPAQLRKLANDHKSISIRYGRIEWHKDWMWINELRPMIERIAHMLPDMDIPINMMDEPRIILPFEEVEQARRRAKDKNSAHMQLKLESVQTGFTGFRLIEEKVERAPWTEKRGPFWPVAIEGCSPTSPARTYDGFKTDPVAIVEPELFSRMYQYDGFIEDYDAALDICQQPELKYIHGLMIQPVSTSYRNDLIPLFGGSKLSTNNEIIIPAPKHYADDDWYRLPRRDKRYTFEQSWSKLSNQTMWRGTPTGGQITDENWTGFHRHRFVAMTNRSQLHYSMRDWQPPNWHPFDLDLKLTPRAARYNNFSDLRLETGFTEKVCDKCAANHYFSPVIGQSLVQQVESKFLPDIDGNSFSARFRAFLMSDGVPIKSTIFKTWSDKRLVAWHHFVPMSVSFYEFFAILEYFLDHDDRAMSIAKEGRLWADKVMRREDMEVYTLRLLLEYARVSDDHRDRLGFINDLRAR